MVARTELVAALAAVGALVVPPEPVRYTVAQLDCARFQQTARTEIETSLAGRPRQESAAVDGRLVLRASAAGRDSVRLEAWFDTLDVWRRSAEGTLQPETDGLIGGRYRGVLSPAGRYRVETKPFVPDEVAEVVDLSTTLDDLLPRLPPVPLGVGQVWRDSAGVEIRRLSDSAAASGEPLFRFRLTDQREAQQAPLKGDSIPIRLRQSTREEGVFAWHPRDGIVRRDRRVAVETYIPAEGRLRRAVRSRLDQRIVLQRLSADEACPGRSAAPDRTGGP